MTTVPMEPVAAPEPRWRALRGTNVADRLCRTVLTTLALLLPLLLLALVGELAVSAWPAIRRFGLSFLWTSVGGPGAGIYGAAPKIFGTVSREVLLAVPVSQREAALGMGATRWEAVWTAVVPYGRAGLIGAVILGLGRALGETMAVTMLIGNRHDIGLSVLQPAYTMAAAIANEFSQATTDLYLSALFEVGLILVVITVGLAAVIGLPIGIGAGSYLAEDGSGRLGWGVRFVEDVLNGTPAVVVGIFAGTWRVKQMGHLPALAGSVALAVLMGPMLART